MNIGKHLKWSHLKMWTQTVMYLNEKTEIIEFKN
jgi:hypothetical protein